MAKVVVASLADRTKKMAEQAELTCAGAEAIIGEWAAVEKAGNPLIPIDSLRQMITARDRCACQTVVRLSKPD
jgi:hypothetical protein